MIAILSVFVDGDKKKNSIIDFDNIPDVPVELRAEVIGKGGVIIATKEAGAESFTTTGEK